MSKKIAKNKMTFRQVLADVAFENSQRLMDKARSFSYLAKNSENLKQVKLSYHYKSMCLKQLIEKCKTASITPHPSKTDPDLMLVRLQGCGALHTKRQWMNSVA